MTPVMAATAAPGRLIRLDRNERLTPAAGLVALLPSIPPETLNVYPDPAPLESALADFWDIDRSRVIATAGGDDAIDRICRGLVGPGAELVTVAPTFEMFPFFAGLAGVRVRALSTMSHPAPVDGLRPLIGPDTGAVIAISPHNPTGLVATTDDLTSLAESLPAGVPLIVDLAYVEFADADPTPVLLESDNVVVIRTLSKAWGLAGARVGYAMGPADAIDSLRRSGPPFPLAGPSLWLAQRALALEPTVTGPYVAAVRSERRRLTSVLAAIGADPIPSEANFVLARFPDSGRAVDALEAARIRIRRFSRAPDLLRISLPGDERVFRRLVDALEALIVETT